MIRHLFIALLLIFAFLSCTQPALAQARRGLEVDAVEQLNSRSERLLRQVPDSAMRLSKLALEASEKIAFRQGMAKAVFNLGQYYKERGELNQAAYYYEQAKEQYELLADTAQLAWVHSELGNLLRSQQLYSEAHALYKQAIFFATAAGSQSLLARVHKDRGGLYYFMGEPDSALISLRKSLRLCQKNENPTLRAAILNNLGVVYKKEGQFREALDHLKRALHYFEQADDRLGLSIVLLNLGEVFQEFARYGESEQYFKRGLSIADSLKATSRQLEGHNNLANLYSELDNFEQAFYHQQKVTELTEQFYQEKVEGKVAELSARLQAEREERVNSQLLRQRELAYLNQEIHIGQLALSRKSSLIYLSLVSLVLAGALALFFYKRQHKGKRENARLSKQKEAAALRNQELTKINVRLQDSEKRLKELIDTKDKLFGILAHDMRSPLYTLMGLVQVLGRDVNSFTREELSQLSGQIERSLQGLSGLLDNLFQWATSDKGLVEFSTEEFRVQDIIEEQMALFSVVAQVKDITLLDESVESPLYVEADAQMLRLVLRNLISNAIKYTARGGMVRLCLTQAADAFEIRVADNGIGMSAEEVASIFHKQHLGNSRRGTENEKGTGLGLLLCREFMQKHGGSLSIQSEIDQGTSVVIRLPKQVGKRKMPSAMQSQA